MFIKTINNHRPVYRALLFIITNSITQRADLYCLCQFIIITLFNNMQFGHPFAKLVIDGLKFNKFSSLIFDPCMAVPVQKKLIVRIDFCRAGMLESFS